MIYKNVLRTQIFKKNTWPIEFHINSMHRINNSVCNAQSMATVPKKHNMRLRVIIDITGKVTSLEFYLTET